MVPGEPPPAQHQQDQGAGGGLLPEQEAPKPYCHPGDTDTVDWTGRGPLEEESEQTPPPQEAQVL